MLASLFVKNFAIIDNIEVDIKKGLTVLTGETGAGKSLLIDAIGLLFGDRASSDLVRHGENKATIEGTFIDYSNDVKEFLLKHDIDEEDVLSIRREIYENGKSVARINGLNVSVALLNELSLALGNIHNQFDTQKLVNPNNYFDYLDNEEIKDLVLQYKQSLKEYRDIMKQYNLFLEQANDLNEKMDYYKFQFQELSKAKLDIQEEENLQAKAKLLSNHEKIANNVSEFLNIFDSGVLDNIYNSMGYLDKLSTYDDSFISKKESVSDAYYALLDVMEEVKSFYNDDEYDERELDNINERLSVYSSLKRKYKMNITELLELQASLKQKIESFDNRDFDLKELAAKKEKLFNITSNIGKNISELRKKQATELEKVLVTNLNDLQLKDVGFKIVISTEEEKNGTYFKPNGIDNIEFLVSFNKGEPLKSLAKTASGGELSRFMLALKAISCGNLSNQTFVFDEIDTGVNGEVAHSIALKIKEIANHSQVICVTHLPQVASIAENHCNIYKVIDGDQKTKTNVEYLDYEGRVKNIALMISKGTLTTASIELAKELLNKN